MKENQRIPEYTPRLVLRETGRSYVCDSVSGPKEAVKIASTFFDDADREMVVVVNLDVKNRPISYNLVSVGGAASSIVDVANVFKTAILSNASKIILLHNHPTDSCEPSEDDLLTTERVEKAGDVLGIPVLDHIIWTHDRCFSIQTCNYL